MQKLKEMMERELLENILPFWMENTVDSEKGGFYGKISNDLEVDMSASKSGILITRILWTFSSAYRIYKEPKYLEMAQRAYNYVKKFLLDKEYGGAYWSLDSYGNPLDNRKQIYTQAFTIYALAEYYRACEVKEALNLAIKIYELVELYAYDPLNKGYLEACDNKWNLKHYCLDGKCGDERKSMNTMLHVVEAYTNLFRIWKDDRIKNSLRECIDVTIKYIIDDETGHFKLFFDEKWKSLSDEYSYGHDIEGSWLLVEAAEVLGDTDLLKHSKDLAIKMAKATILEGIDDEGGVMYEGGPEGVIDSDRHWWGQAEGVVGFVNAYQITGNEEFYKIANRVWGFIENKMIDKQFGEWYWGVTKAGEIMQPYSKVDFWKCPYHNARACMEIVERFN